MTGAKTTRPLMTRITENGDTLPDEALRQRREKLNKSVLAGLEQYKGNVTDFRERQQQKIAHRVDTPIDVKPRSRTAAEKSEPIEILFASHQVFDTGNGIADRSSCRPGDPESGGRHRLNKSRLLFSISLVLLGLVFAIRGFVAQQQQPSGPISINGPALTPTSASILNADVETAQVQIPTAIETKSDPNKLTRVNIEDIRCGMRVPAFNPEISVAERESDADSIGIDPETWRLVHLRLEKEDGTHLDIESLQPVSWLESVGAKVGSSIEFHVPELTSTSIAEVIGVETCPELSAGPDRLVTATYRHESAKIIDITVEGDETIGTTANHPFWCVNTQSFVEADQLEVGQQLKTIDGTAVSITSIAPRGPPESVFNVEVEFEHVYFVGNSALLAHNAKGYSFSSKATELADRLGKSAKGILRRGRIAGTRGLLHSYDRHAAEWFARHGGTPNLAKWQELLETASRSRKIVDWSTGADKTIGHLARINGNKSFFVQFFKEGPRAGEVATAFIPNMDQLRAILKSLGK